MAKKVSIEIEARFTEKGLDNLTQKAAQADKSINNLKKSIDNVGKGSTSNTAFNGIEKSANKAEKAITKTKTAADKLGKTKADINVSVKDKATTYLNKIKSSLKTVAGGKVYNVLLSAKDKASTVISHALGLAKMFGNGMHTAGLYIKDHASEILGSVTSGLKTIANSTWTAVLNVKDHISGTISNITNKLFSLKTAIAGVVGGMAVKKIALDPINFADTMENSFVGFETMLSSTEKANKIMTEIKEFARTTPLDTMGVITSVQQMVNSGQWSADSSAENYVMKDIEKIGNAAMASGGGTDALKGIVLALSQMSMTGRVNAQDMMQLANRNIPAWQMLADYYKKSISEVRQMSKDGDIAAEEGIKAIMQGMERYDGLMKKLSTRTASGIWSNIQDTFQLSIIESWGKGLQSGAIDGLTKFAGWLDKISPKLDKAGASLEQIGEYLSRGLFDILEKGWTRIEDIIDSDAFTSADGIGAKMKVLFGGLWDSFRNMLKEKAPDIGKFTGEMLSKGIINIADFITGALGGDTSGIDNVAADIGASFWDAFCSAFDGQRVMEAVKRAIGTIFSSASKILPGGESPTLSSWISAGLIAKTFGAMGFGKLAGSALGKIPLTKLIGSTGNSMVQGTGLLNLLANLGYKATGGAATAGGYFGAGTAMSGAKAAFTGGGLVVAGVDAIGSGVSAYRNFKKGNTAEGVADVVGGSAEIIGAAIGTAIAPGIGTAIGYGIGKIVDWGAHKVADNYRKNNNQLAYNEETKKFASNYGLDLQKGWFSTKTMQNAIKDTTLTAEELGKAFEYAAKQDLDKRFGKITMSLAELDDMAKQVVFGDNAKAIETFSSAVTEAEQSLSSFKDAQYRISKWNIKTNLGLDIKNEDDVSEFISDVNNYVFYAEDVLSKQQIEAVAAVDVLLDVSEGTTGAKITKNLGDFYTDLQKQINEVTTTWTDGKTKVTLNKAIELSNADGIITIDEQKVINDLLSQIDGIIQKVNSATEKAKLNRIELEFGDGRMTNQNYEDFVKSMDEYVTERKTNADKAFESSTSPLYYQLDELEAQLQGGKIDQASYDKAVADINSQLAELGKGYKLELEAGNVEASIKGIELTAESYADLFGGNKDKAFNAINAALNKWVNSGTDPINLTLADIQADLGGISISNEELASLQPYLSYLFSLYPISVDAQAEVNPDFKLSPEATINAFSEKWGLESPFEPVEVTLPVNTKAEVTSTDTTGLTHREICAKFGLDPTAKFEAVEITQPVNVKQEVSVSQVSSADKLAAGMGPISDSYYKSLFPPINTSTTADVAVSSTYTNSPEEPTIGPFNLSTTGTINIAWSWNKPNITVGSPFLSLKPGNNAAGGIINGKQLSWLAEEGYPEAVIPFDPARRQRALDLYAETGRRLGVLNNANGGIVGDTGYSAQPTISDTKISDGGSKGAVIKMEKGSVQISITADSSQTVSEAIEAQKEAIAEKISGIIGKALGAQFANMPAKGTL